MHKQDLYQFLEEQEHGWDVKDLVEETAWEIEKLFFPPILEHEAFEETRGQWRTCVARLLISLVAEADEILAAHHFAEQRKEILRQTIAKSVQTEKSGAD